MEGDTEGLMTVPDAAREKGVHPKSIYRAVQAGRLAVTRRYGVLLISREALTAWKPKGPGPRKGTGREGEGTTEREGEGETGEAAP